MGRLKSQTNPSGETITYSYDGVGNITEVQTPTQTITKSYDALNRLKTVTDTQGTVTYTYDAIGRQTTAAYSNGLETHHEYDSRNRVTNIEHTNSTGTVLQSFAYTLDSVGNRTKIVEHTGRTVDYAYNEVHQLTKETITHDPSGHNTTTSFTYDAVGNLLTKTIDGVDTSYAYNDNDQLTAHNSTTLTYDSNGNLVSNGANSYDYDDKNRLTKVTTPTDTIEYTYDANDNRIAKTTTAGTITYLIDTNTPYAQVITQSKENGTQVNYTYGNDLLSQNEEAQSLFCLADALGSTKALADQTENITDHYTYSPYGELIEHSGTSDNPFLFTGEQFDTQTQDYYLRARYYSPNTTRFLTRDSYDGTLTEPVTQNHYLYAGSNPGLYVDPSGRFGVAGLSLASNIQSSLQNIQIGTYSNLLDASFGGGDVGSDFLWGTASAVGGVVAYKLLLKLSSKFRKATNNGLSIFASGGFTVK
jgi:RHS repeat-associated protein